MIIDKILSNKSIKNGIESGKDYGRFYMGDSERTGSEVGAEGYEHFMLRKHPRALAAISCVDSFFDGSNTHLRKSYEREYCPSLMPIHSTN